MQASFTIPGKPMGKQRPRVYGRHAVTPEATVNYENWVRLCWQEANGRLPMMGKPIRANVSLYYPIPDSWSGKKKNEAQTGKIRPIVKPDIDNCIKILFDPLNGIAFRDDAQIVEITATKYYSDQARVEVTLEEIEP
jgi:Holliday junction resolvase RusA-like endonuclease